MVKFDVKILKQGFSRREYISIYWTNVCLESDDLGEKLRSFLNTDDRLEPSKNERGMGRGYGGLMKKQEALKTPELEITQKSQMYEDNDSER